ncbi:uncharacterized protein Pyn_08865 [Prunus yedoensis var. nudiflora]|uniref:Uncharacterized protein n=1 Tax=Prunus yedoensis var. nudiflora TaxID=2094558 RepID=A0A314ZE35_PRUYE|nr:uncharacterized protein Pyn_08865 [Prunus yedoensis var. nudiflora]
MAAKEGEFGFEEGMLWLPSQVLDEAICDTKAYSRLQVQHHQHHHLNSKPSSIKPHHHRPKANVNWSSGGPGMQAIFLDSSSQRSCGTGVFLPQRAGSNSHKTKTPACAPVLLPSRVVQALNLNVHALGLQISPRQDVKDHKRKDGDCISAHNKSGNKDVPSTQCYIISQNPNSSPELFLPKEWTY